MPQHATYAALLALSMLVCPGLLPDTGEGYSRTYFEQSLELFLEAGKAVFTVDYAQEPAYVAEAYERASTQGYIPYVTLLALDHLTDTPPPDYPE